MSEKRRDNKNRILQSGESQRPDGRYRYTYKDIHGKKKDVYSWRLDKSDPYPQGKRRDLSLREKKKSIERDILDEMVPNGDGHTVLSIVEKYVSLKTGRAIQTMNSYNSFIKLLQRDELGKKSISKIKTSDAKAWLIKQYSVYGKSYGTVNGYKVKLQAAFQIAVIDNLIRNNPFSFSLASVISFENKEATVLTPEQQTEYLSYIKNSSCYKKRYDWIYFLLGTGLRVSEFCGLTLSDIDFENSRIKVDHQLQYSAPKGYYISKPKTQKGIRYVPMSKNIELCVKRIIANRPVLKNEPVVDGYTNFLFISSRTLNVISAQVVDGIFESIKNRYNKHTETQPIHVTPHTLRHTFCSNLIRSGMNPVRVQYIMGHADIDVTLKTYTHLGYDEAEEEFRKYIG